MGNYYLPLFFLISLACTSPEKNSEKESQSAPLTSDTTKGEQLSEAETREGWQVLFDGKSLSGWTFYNGAENNSWEVIDGTLHCKPFNDNGPNMRSDLITEKQYSDFELMFDWKISAQGNSGVIYRVVENDQPPYATGPEYQLLDDNGYPGDVKEVHLTGGVYGMYAPSDTTANKSPGEWNTSRVVAKENHIEHWLNGTLVSSYDLNSADWKKRLQQSKWKDFPGYGTADAGHIDLQDHGNEVWFRKIKIRPL